MYKTIEKMLIKMRDELIEEIARNRKMETNDLKDEIGDPVNFVYMDANSAAHLSVPLWWRDVE